MSILEVRGLAHSFGERMLYENASFALNRHEHMGLTGANGCGKSTLMSILTGDVLPLRGDVVWQRGVRMGYLDQYAKVDGRLSVGAYLETAFQDFFELEKETESVYEAYALSGDTRLLERASMAQERLEASGFYDRGYRIDAVMDGLGLSPIGKERAIDTLSGGQRARVMLAKLLLQTPDALLLDEPTNFLDKEHVDWLAEYMAAFENAFIVISHDEAFLRRVTDTICDVDAGTVRVYRAGYAEFTRQKAEHRAEHIRGYEAQQAKIAKTEDFIRRNIAGVNSRIARGRRKHLERMERIEAPSFTSAKPEIRFPELPVLAQEFLNVRSLSVGYDAPVLPPLSFTVYGGEKIVITGFNGVGKSTLMKTLTKELSALGGTFGFAQQVRAGYFAQSAVWSDGSETPFDIVSNADSRLASKDVRRLLARCGVNSEHIAQRVDTLSGGEQAKVRLCLLTLRPYNFLLLDEPTNHLDADAKEALREALAAFRGSVILVSHEEAFYRDWAGRVLCVGNNAA